MTLPWWSYFRIRYMLTTYTETSFSSPTGTLHLKLPETIDYPANYEPILSQELCDRTATETVFYDIGCGFGYFPKLLTLNGINPENIHAFEANPERYLVCQENCDNRVHISPSLVGETAGKRRTTVDEYATANPHPDIVKIDVEGAEFNVLNGMTKTITENHPDIYVEIHPRYLAESQTPVTKIVQLLIEHGYEVAVNDHRETSNAWKEVATPVDIEQFDLPEKTYMARASAATDR